MSRQLKASIDERWLPVILSVGRGPQAVILSVTERPGGDLEVLISTADLREVQPVIVPAGEWNEETDE